MAPVFLSRRALGHTQLEVGRHQAGLKIGFAQKLHFLKTSRCFCLYAMQGRENILFKHIIIVSIIWEDGCAEAKALMEALLKGSNPLQPSASEKCLTPYNFLGTVHWE